MGSVNTRAIASRAVRVAHESLRDETMRSINGILFLPSLNELGYQFNGINQPVREGRTLQAFAEGAQNTEAVWTRTDRKSREDRRNDRRAVDFTSSHLATATNANAVRRVTPLINITPDLRVSYFVSEDGTRRVR